MNKRLFKVFSLITILALMLAAMPVQSALAATTIAQWTFESPNTPADVSNVATYPNMIAPTVGSGNATGFHAAAATDWTTPAGNGSVDSFSSNEWAIGDYYGFTVSTLNFTGIQVSWDQTRSSTGPATFKLAYSTDGTTFTDFGSPYAIAALTWSSGGAVTGSSFTFDLSGVTAIDNQANVYFRLINTVAPGGTGGTNRVDNFTVSGEPIVAGDAAPSANIVPANGAVNVAVDANIDVTFSEPVNVTGNWFSISCGTSGAHSATVSGGPTTFTLDPDSDFANSESCTVTIVAAQVTDQDANDPPDIMAADSNSSFTTVAPPVVTSVIINEVDADNPSTDTLEFVELYDGGAGNTDLSGLTVVFYNGNGDTSYAAFDLDGYSTNGSGYFVLGNSAVTPAPGIVFNNDSLQNGQDAVALYGANATDFPNGTLVTTTNLIDALVYDTTDADDPGLLVLLNAGQPQIDENGGGNGTAHSNQRCPNGSGGTRNTSTYAQFNPSAGTANNCANDNAPSVTGTNPTNGAINVLNGSNIDITFSENVNANGSWFSISCTLSGAHTAVASGGATTFTLDPDSDFVNNETCTVTVAAAQVADQDANDPPDNMAADYVFSFSTEGPVCDQSYTPIYNIQGSNLSAAITGNVTTKGVVVGDFETSAGVQGFYIQDAAGDGNAATSDGILVVTGPTTNAVNLGDLVRVTGFARERFNQTAIQGANDNNSIVPAENIINCGTGGSVEVTDITMPFSSTTFLERYEGMYVRFPQSLVIAEYFNYDQFGEIVLALPLDGETRPFTGTAIDEPGPDAIARTLANSLRRVTLDDAQGGSNPVFLRHPNGSAFSVTPTRNLFRGGDLVQNAIGVLGFDFSLYRIYPTGPADYTQTNPRPIEPEEVGGSLRVAAMNTLNFFLTLDTTANDNGPGPCGGLQNLDCRGADSDQPDEFERQRDKLLQALAGLDADVIGLNELENTPGVDPLGDPTNGIVAGLNSIFGPGTYASVNTGVTGTDAIRVGIIYRPGAVQPVGDPAVLASQNFVNPRNATVDRNRPAVAQTFEEIATGARFTVVVNHLKSKGSGCGTGDDDTTNGQGNCNLTRTMAAQVLVDWLATDPTGSGDPDFLIMGDLNSYAKEAPIDAILAGSDDTPGTGDDYTNLISDYQGTYAYSYTFDGQAGYLDHALANTSLAAQIVGAADWHINSDEADAVDYDTTFKPASQEALYEENPYRSSDHDPVIVGLDLVNAAPSAANDNYSTDEDTALTVAAPGVLSNDSDAEDNSLTASLVSEPSNGSVTINADGSFTYTPNSNFNGSDSFTYKANDGYTDSTEATVNITVNAVNDAPVCATPQSGSTNEDTVLGGSLVCSDVDSAFSYSKVNDPSHGTVTVNTDGTFTYTPSANYNGSDSFTFKANDGSVDSNVATFNISIAAVNDDPNAVDDSASLRKNGSVVILIYLNDTDVDGDTLNVISFTQPSHGTVSYSTRNRNFRYTPARGFTGTDTFTYTISDGNGGTDTATVTITVHN